MLALQVGIERVEFLDCGVLVGRSSVCDVQSLDLTVSGQHAFLSQDREGNWSVQDLNSKNGTYVNGAIVDGKTPVKSGDWVKVGDRTSFYVINA